MHEPLAEDRYGRVSVGSLIAEQPPTQTLLSGTKNTHRLYIHRSKSADAVRTSRHAWRALACSAAAALNERSGSAGAPSASSYSMMRTRREAASQAWQGMPHMLGYVGYMVGYMGQGEVRSMGAPSASSYSMMRTRREAASQAWQGMPRLPRSARSAAGVIAATAAHSEHTSWLMLPCISTVAPAAARRHAQHTPVRCEGPNRRAPRSRALTGAACLALSKARA